MREERSDMIVMRRRRTVGVKTVMMMERIGGGREVRMEISTLRRSDCL